MKGKLFLIAAAGAILAGCAQVSGAPQASGAAQYQSLDNTIEPVKAAFNRDVNKTRLILLVSPTCGECLRGSSEIQDTVFAHETSPNLTAYVVWVPELGAKSENVPGGMALIPDKRANNYWDAQELLGHAYKTILPTPTVAWDVYLVYRAGVRWNGEAPPKPDYWMSQLEGTTAAPRLNPTVFKSHVDDLLFACGDQKSTPSNA